MKPDAIMVFAAGHGTRMGALTNACPKPMLPVSGILLIDRALALADQAGIGRKVVNTHYLGHMLAEHLQTRKDVFLSPEPQEALETGGGLKKALPLLDAKTVYTLNPDAVWTGPNPLDGLAASWQPEKMDALLMLVALDDANGHSGQGDFTMDKQGRLTRFRTGDGPAFVNTGAQILKTSTVAGIAQSKFSQNIIWDRLIKQGRLFGCVHNAGWADVGTPKGIILAEAMLKAAGDV